MIKKLLILSIFSFLMISCGSSKNVRNYSTSKTLHTQEKAENKTKEEVTVADKIVWTAVSYKGIPYRFGGTTEQGMDCSGLIYTSFQQRDVPIARTSREMYAQGTSIPLRKVQRGDLLFFITARKRGKVNHVGLVTSVSNGDIRFIHSTSSQGVIVTSLHEDYWKRAFIEAKRVL